MADMKKKNQKNESALTRGELTDAFKGLITHMDKRFDVVDKKFEDLETRLTAKIDKIDYKVTGLAGRVEVLEDTIRVIKTKLSIQ